MRQLEAGQIIAGKYRLQRPLAKGGMGSVWTAWNEQLEVPVAVKFMSPEAIGSAELVARFEREAKAAAQLRCPQVVQIFEHGVFDDLPFMAMELLDGQDLGKRLRARGRLPLFETARIVGEVCKALRRAHELGIVHRDLKPANVFLAQTGDDEVVKVLDFGIAKVLSAGPGAEGSEATKTGALIGTPHYMSPEQARRTNRQVDHRSDLWSLGVIAFRAITGKLPFAGEDMVDVLVRICTQPAPLASSIAPDVGPAVDRFFVQALAFEPDHRFQTAREFVDAMNVLVGTAVPQPLGQPSGGAPQPRLPSSSSIAAPEALQLAAQDLASPASPSAPRALGPAEPRPQPTASPGAAVPELLDGATTLPIRGAPAGGGGLPGASTPPGTVQPGGPVLGLAPAARLPDGMAPHGPPLAASSQPRSTSAPSPPSPHAPSQWGHSSPPLTDGAPTGASEAGSVPIVSTLRLGPPAVQAPPARGSYASIPDTSVGPGGAAYLPGPAAAMTSAGDSSGTITSATGELPALRQRRTPHFVWAGSVAGLLVVIAGGFIGTKLWPSSGEEPAEPPRSTAAPVKSADLVPVTVAPPPVEAPPVTATAASAATGTGEAGSAATATARSMSSASPGPSVSPSIARTASPPAKPAGAPSAAPKPPRTTVIFADPVFKK